MIGSNQLIEVKGKKIRGRLYPWGVVEVENPEHNDFLKLRTMLVWVSLALNLIHVNGYLEGKSTKTITELLPFAGVGKTPHGEKALLPSSVCKWDYMSVFCRTHMQDLQEVTQDLHYENFRSERLKRAGRWDTDLYCFHMGCFCFRQYY